MLLPKQQSLPAAFKIQLFPKNHRFDNNTSLDKYAYIKL